MPPQSTAASVALWKSDDPAAWRAALDAYHTRMGALNNDKLVQLDRWYHEDLPGAIAARRPPHMLASELVKLVDWKMTRGKVRPRLLEFAKAHSDKTVRDATSVAIARLGGAGGSDEEGGEGGGSSNMKTTAKAILNTDDIPSALEPLVALKGMGPATASAVLAAADTSLPFMSDDIIAVALPPTGSSDTYSTPRLLQLASKVRAKAKKVGLTAGEVERAVYSEAALTKKPKKDSAAGARAGAGAGGNNKKRKR